MLKTLVNYQKDSIFLIRDTVTSNGSFLLFPFLTLLQGPILFLGFSQDQEHYQQIQKKLGVNVDYRFIGCMELTDILGIVQNNLEKHLIIDDITPILFTSDLKNSLILLKGIIEHLKGSFVVLTHQIKEDEELNSFNTWLQYQSNLVITCNPLDSGYTDGVDGQLTVRVGPQKGSGINGELLYKQSDSGTVYFAKGTANL
ncbi:hypothetical protein HDV06_004163 [Boothiomyces sp. JEL0866]|nr:hypothetical protein HDV06_004163 [Boothiomyces sp. JEL0866]